VGPMLRVAKYAGAVAMFYATAGILAQAQSVSSADWLLIYYQWILPSSAPAMFLFSFWIQSVDPITTAERDTITYEHLTSVEARRENLDIQRLTLNERRDMRLLRAHVQKQRLLALWKEAVSRRTRSTLRRAVRLEVPRILRSLNVPIDEIPPRKFSSFGRYSEPSHHLDGHEEDPLA